MAREWLVLYGCSCSGKVGLLSLQGCVVGFGASKPAPSASRPVHNTGDVASPVYLTTRSDVCGCTRWSRRGWIKHKSRQPQRSCLSNASPALGCCPTALSATCQRLVWPGLIPYHRHTPSTPPSCYPPRQAPPLDGTTSVSASAAFEGRILGIKDARGQVSQTHCAPGSPYPSLDHPSWM